MALKSGSLEHFGGTKLLRLMTLAKKTGGLRVRGDSHVELSFDNGKLIYASMGNADGSLPHVLADDGRISKKQATALTAHAEKMGDKQLGILLIQKGYVSRADIIRSLKRHEEGIIRQFAVWKKGDWDFDPAYGPDEDRITFPIELENIIVEIAREAKRDEQLELEIPSLDVRLKFGTKPTVKVEDLKLSKEELLVLKYVKPENSIRMIAKELKLTDNQIRRIVGSLREAGLVELVADRSFAPQTPEEKKERRDIVGRLINHFQKA